MRLSGTPSYACVGGFNIFAMAMVNGVVQRSNSKGCFGIREVVQSQSEKDMASTGSFACAANFSPVGSRRTRAAAFGDDTTDEAVTSTSRSRGQLSPDEQGVSTSSGETIVRNEGELIPPDPHRAMHIKPGGLGSSYNVPVSQMIICPGRDRRR